MMNIQSSHNAVDTSIPGRTPVDRAARELHAPSSRAATHAGTTGPTETKPATSAGSTDAASSPTIGPFNELDLQSLMEHWGQSDSKYDLDGSGLVDVDDLLLLIANYGSQPAASPAPAPPPGSAEDPAASDPAAARAKHDPVATPDASLPKPDIASLAADVALTANPGPPAVLPGNATNVSQTPVPSNPPVQGPFGSEDLGKLIASWNEPGSGYDLDGNGVVDVDDLLLMIQNWQPASPPSGSLAAPDLANWSATNEDIAAREKPGAARSERAEERARGRGSHAVDPSSASNGHVRKIADALVERLEAAGFDAMPPLNMREIIEGLHLNMRDRKQMLEVLQARYPRGLGVNVKA